MKYKGWRVGVKNKAEKVGRGKLMEGLENLLKNFSFILQLWKAGKEM